MIEYLKRHLSKVTLQSHSTKLQGSEITDLMGQYHATIKQMAERYQIDPYRSSIVMKAEVSVQWIIVYLTCLFYNIKLVLIPKHTEDIRCISICTAENAFLYISDRAMSRTWNTIASTPYYCDMQLGVLKHINLSEFISAEEVFTNDWEEDIVLKSYADTANLSFKHADYTWDNLTAASLLFHNEMNLSSYQSAVLIGDMYMEHANVILGLFRSPFKLTIYTSRNFGSYIRGALQSSKRNLIVCNKTHYESNYMFAEQMLEIEYGLINRLKYTPILNKLYWLLLKKIFMANMPDSTDNIVVLGGLDSPAIWHASESKMKLPLSYTFSTIQTTGCAILCRHGDRKTCEFAQLVLYNKDFPVQGGEIYAKGDIVARNRYMSSPDKMLADDCMTSTEYYGEYVNGILFPVSPIKDIIIGTFELPINARNLEDLARDLPYVKDIMLITVSNELYLLAYPDVEKCEKNGFDIVLLQALLETYKITLNKNLPDHNKIKKIVVFQKMFDAEEKFLFRTAFNK